jgi:Family of unknown function (DUF6152)
VYRSDSRYALKKSLAAAYKRGCPANNHSTESDRVMVVVRQSVAAPEVSRRVNFAFFWRRRKEREMKIERLGVSCAIACSLIVWGSASAHHSFAMFDKDKQVTLVGDVKEFQWTNPHVWLQLVTQDDAGQSAEWSIEMASVNILAREGWKRSSFKPGDKVTIVIHPLRDGSHGGSLIRATTAAGVTIPPNGESASAQPQ